ncbi:MAG: 3-methyl-2-oxobutanoate hydroxymethyltransferase [Bacillota bacterium]|nr:3-methyl-2-oxobutanoate hydroxymethyltransferase [Bacillota bacterium]
MSTQAPAPRPKVTVFTLHEKMAKGEKITMLTAYDYPLGLLEERAGIDIILVGDSMGMTVLGYETTLPVTMDEMVNHAAAVRRGAPSAFLIGDMPYMTYQPSVESAIRNAGRFMAEAGCDCVKLEGGSNVVDIIHGLVKATIPVMGHIGLTPQSLAQLGGFKAQGRTAETALQLIKDAKALEEAGVCSLLVEAVPEPVAGIIAQRSQVPVIGIGSGARCHGVCLIVHDMLGFFDRFTPRFVKKYADLNGVIGGALQAFKDDVAGGGFPAKEHNYGMPAAEMARLREMI